MYSPFQGFWLEYMLGLTILVVIFYRFWINNYAYWKDRNVPHIAPKFPFGASSDLVLSRTFNGHVLRDIYFQLKEHKYGGIFVLRKPVLILRDPEVIKHILTKDFNKFVNRGTSIDEEKDPLLAHLFHINDDRWKKLRTKLSPTFTSGKMKMMFHLVKACGVELQKSLLDHAENKEVIELKEYMARYGTDVIGSCAFGLDIDSINNPDSEFRIILKDLFAPSISVLLRNNLNSIIPGLNKLIRVKSSPKERDEFFFRIVGETVEYREKNNVKRNDFLDLLIQIKNKGCVDDESRETETNNDHHSMKSDSSNDLHLTRELMTAQCFVFFVAGFETSSTTLSFCLYELALNKEIQSKLREEVDRVLVTHNQEISYEALKQMNYMDRVVQETLRKYSPLGSLTRECDTDYQMPDSKLLLKKGVKVIIPVYGIHYDPEYYPDPERFDPDRFTEEAKNSRPNYTWLPFGEGPRNCIGMRFGLMQVKTGLTTLISKYEFDVTQETQVPMKMGSSLLAAPECGIRLKISKRI